MRHRIPIVLLALTAAALPAATAASASAAPRHNDGLTIAAAPNPIVAGDGVLIYGSLKGTDVASQTIKLYHRVAPAAKFTLIQKTTTNATGFYDFTRAEGVVTSNRNWYVTGPDGTHSRTVHEHVSAQVTLNDAGTTADVLTGQHETYTGSIFPAHKGSQVRLQEQTAISGNGWATIARGTTNAISDFSIAKAISRPGIYTLRAELVGDARNVTSVSDSTTVVVQQKQIAGFSINGSDPIVTAGQPATISGTDTATPGTTVTLYGATHGGAEKAIFQTQTNATDGYSFTVTPSANTVYVVRAGGGHHSADLNLGVADVVSATPSSNSISLGAPLTVTGVVTPSHRGHAIYLQKETSAGHWTALSSSVVAAGSKYSLATRFGKAGTYTLRVRIFGGPENVGSASTPFTVAVSGTAVPSTLAPAG